jgi:hypothetical protein
MGTAVRPAKTSPGAWDASADVDVFGTKRRRNSRPWRGRVPGRCDRPKAAAGGRGAAQARHGDLECLFLWHAVARDLAAGRHAIRRAL